MNTLRVNARTAASPFGDAPNMTISYPVKWAATTALIIAVAFVCLVIGGRLQAISAQSASPTVCAMQLPEPSGQAGDFASRKALTTTGR